MLNELEKLAKESEWGSDAMVDLQFKGKQILRLISVARQMAEALKYYRVTPEYKVDESVGDNALTAFKELDK